MNLVPIKAGQWVLSYVGHNGPDPFSQDLIAALERLQRGGSGWGYLFSADEQFKVLQVSRVMPKTFISSDERHPRYLVVAAGESASEMQALGDMLFEIGFAADRADELAGMAREALFATPVMDLIHQQLAYQV